MQAEAGLFEQALGRPHFAHARTLRKSSPVVEFADVLPFAVQQNGRAVGRGRPVSFMHEHRVGRRRQRTVEHQAIDGFLRHDADSLVVARDTRHLDVARARGTDRTSRALAASSETDDQ